MLFAQANVQIHFHSLDTCQILAKEVIPLSWIQELTLVLLLWAVFSPHNVNIRVSFFFNSLIPIVCTGETELQRAFAFACSTLWRNRLGQCKDDCMVLLGKRPQVLWNRIWNSWTTAVFYFKIDNICNAYGPRHVWRHRQTIWMVSKDTCT